MARLLSTRARAQLWKLQEEVRTAMKERERLLRILSSSRTALTPSAHRELWMEFSCADQEYRHAVSQLQGFCEKHGESAAG
jgi:hypothetical protein